MHVHMHAHACTHVTDDETWYGRLRVSALCVYIRRATQNTNSQHTPGGNIGGLAIGLFAKRIGCCVVPVISQSWGDSCDPDTTRKRPFTRMYIFKRDYKLCVANAYLRIIALHDDAPLLAVACCCPSQHCNNSEPQTPNTRPPTTGPTSTSNMH